MTTATTPERARLTRAELQTLDAEASCERCLAPAIVRLRGQSLTQRLEVHATLSPPQRALLGFWLIYHYGRRGWREFRVSLQHVMLYEGFWPDLESAARHFGLDALATLIAEVARLESCSSAAQDAALADLDTKLVPLRQLGITRVAETLRATPQDYMDLTT